MGKFGKKNHVNLDPLSYNICLLGESKCGKTTIIKEVCEKLVGDDGYIFLEIGHERGADAIEGISYINTPKWNMDYDEDTNSAGFADVVDDIINNKVSDYQNLKVVVWDTYDQLINIAEDESVRLYNKTVIDKKVKTINQAWGGFGRGEKKAIEFMLDKFAELRSVGVSVIVIGHIKTKDMTDPVTGETFQILTSDQQQNYFNALKKNMHFLGLAYIDREIVKEKKKNKASGNIEKGRIASETRKIKFRDDNYAVDSGSRFADIVPEIEMNADDFIKALTGAILSEQKKSNIPLEEEKKRQDSEKEKADRHVAEREKEHNTEKNLENIIKQIKEFCINNKSTPDLIRPLVKKAKEMGYDSPYDVSDIEDAKVLLGMTKQK